MFDWLISAGGYNTLVVLTGTALLGVGAGVIGTFVLLNRKSMVSDAISHATLPGIAAGFLLAWELGIEDGRHLPLLLTGAALTGALAAAAVQWITHHTRLPEDTAIGSVLGFTFGLGVVLLSYIQTIGQASQAGLNSFLLGESAALTFSESEFILAVTAAVAGLSVMCMRALASVCFDPQYTATLGWPPRRIELMMMGLLLLLLCIGLKTVGLILMVALLIIPPVSARMWTPSLKGMILIAAILGGISCCLGVVISAGFQRLPTGASIVLASGGLLLLSLLLAPERGLLVSWWRHLAIKLRLRERQLLLELPTGRPPSWNARVHMWLRGWLNPKGTLNLRGQKAARAALLDAICWQTYLQNCPQATQLLAHWGRRSLTDILPHDIAADLEQRAQSAIEKDASGQAGPSS